MTGAVTQAQSGRYIGGVTLIELLVALVIMAVLTAAVTLAIPDFGTRRSDAVAERVLARIAMACERAAVSGRDVGIEVTSDGLRFGQFELGAFQPWLDDPSEPLRPQTLPDGLRLRLERDGHEIALDDERPSVQLACQASGELTPFELVLLRAAQPLWRMRGLASGALQRERVTK